MHMSAHKESGKKGGEKSAENTYTERGKLEELCHREGELAGVQEWGGSNSLVRLESCNTASGEKSTNDVGGESARGT